MVVVQQWLRPKPVAIGAGFGLIALLGFIDYVSGTEVSFALFYFLPVFIGAWLVGRMTGICMGLASGAIGLLADMADPSRTAHPLVPFFNLLTRSGAFIVVSLLVSAMRDLTETLEERVERRTNQLKDEVAERKRAEAALKESEERFRIFMNNSPAVAFIKDDSGRYVYVNTAFQRRFREPVLGKTSSDLFPPEAASRLLESDKSVTLAGKTLEFFETLPFPDGTLSHWINFRFPLRDASGRLFVGGVSVDITELRKLERQLLEISDREQARIGQDLHDGLCQILVSAAFDCHLLEQRLASGPASHADSARQIGALLDDAITQARQVARGLYPVKLEADGLVSALEELAGSTIHRFKIRCSLEWHPPLSVPNNAVATHLYRIAQEAVTNAVRHSRAQQIRIKLLSSDHSVEMEISDDGIGMTPGTPPGMGLHIMDYRTRTIGGRLKVAPGENSGTTISCRVPLQNLST
jgi:PAS domain S-box-containing protein